MAANELGYVTLPVIPSFRGASTILEKELTASKAGTVAGVTTGKQFGQGFSKTVAVTGAKGTKSLFTQAEKGATAAGLGLGRRAGASITKGLKDYAKIAGATVVGYFAYEKVKELVTGVFQEGEKAQQTLHLLEAHIQSTGGAAHVTAAHVTELAQAQSKLVGVDEDTITTAATLELTFANVRNEVGKGNDIFDRTLTTTEDVAASLGKDLTGSLRLVGRAVNDPIHGMTSLTRVGIQFTTQQQDQIKALEESGRTLEAQKLILDTLATRFGGSAAAADTPLKQLTADFQTWEQNVGLKLIPILNEGATVLVSVGGGIEQLVHLAGELPAPLRDVALALIGIKLATGVANLIGLPKVFSAIGREARVQATSIGVFGRSLIGLRGGALAAGIGLGELAAHTHGVVHDLASIGSDAAIGATFGPWGAAVGGAVGLLTTLGQREKFTATDVDTLTGSLDTQTGAVTKNTRELVANALQQQGVFDAARTLNLNLETVTSAATGNTQAQQDLRDVLKQLEADYTGASGSAAANTIATAEGSVAAGNMTGSNQKLIDTIKSIIDATGSEAGATKAARVAHQQLTDALGGDAAAKAGATGATKKLGDQTRSTALATQHLTAAEDALQHKFDSHDSSLAGFTLTLEDAKSQLKGLLKHTTDETDAVQKNAHALDLGTKAGATLYQQFSAIAQGASQVKGGVDAQRTAIEKAKTAIEEIGVQYGLTDGSAKRIADRMLNDIPAAAKATQKQLDVTTQSAKALDQIDPNIDVTANTDTAKTKIQTFTESVASLLAGIPDEPVNVTLTAQDAKVLNQLGNLGGAFADGGGVFAGPVRGPGGPRDDRVLIRASNGERVNRADIVTKAGGGSNPRGQAVFAAFERLILRGELGRVGDLQPFADGGPVLTLGGVSGSATGAVASIESLFASIIQGFSAAASKRADHLLTSTPGVGALGPGGVLTPGQIVRGQSAAFSQLGKPYIWGGVGPAGYDCSGFQSFVLNSALGFANPYFRRGTTGTMPWPGSGPGPGRYTIGWTPSWDGSGVGHTSGNIGGLNVESYGGHGPAVGSGARSPYDPHFSGLMHYADGGPVVKMDAGGYLRPGLNRVWNGMSRPEVVPDPRVGSGDVVAAIERLGRELSALRADLVRTGVRFQNPDVVDGRARTVARGQDYADQRHDRRLVRMGGRKQ